MGFPQLQHDLRWYPHRRKRTLNHNLTHIRLTYMRSRHSVRVFCWHRPLYIWDENMDIVTRQAFLVLWASDLQLRQSPQLGILLCL